MDSLAPGDDYDRVDLLEIARISDLELDAGVLSSSFSLIDFLLAPIARILRPNTKIFNV